MEMSRAPPPQWSQPRPSQTTDPETHRTKSCRPTDDNRRMSESSRVHKSHPANPKTHELNKHCFKPLCLGWRYTSPRPQLPSFLLPWLRPLSSWVCNSFCIRPGYAVRQTSPRLHRLKAARFIFRPCSYTASSAEAPAHCSSGIQAEALPSYVAAI